MTSPPNHQTFHRHTTHSTSRPHYLQTTTASTAKANPQTVHTKRNFQRKLRPKEPSTDCHFSAPLTPRRLHAFIESLVGVETHKRPVHRRTRPTTARRQPARRSGPRRHRESYYVSTRLITRKNTHKERNETKESSLHGRTTKSFLCRRDSTACRRDYRSRKRDTGPPSLNSGSRKDRYRLAGVLVG